MTNHKNENLYIIGNWKMHKNWHEMINFSEQLETKLTHFRTNIKFGLAVPYLYLQSVAKRFNQKIIVSSQDFYHKTAGAFTGAVSAEMVRSTGAKYAIIGHSERRNLFNDDYEIINKKIKLAFENDLTPILCVGESLEVFQAQITRHFIKQQLTSAWNQINIDFKKQIIIAYEPIWAIGTGETATPEIAQKICSYIRTCISEIFNETIAKKAIILYGGSVKPNNAKTLAQKEDINGFLIGGASLNFDDFIQIANNGWIGKNKLDE